MSGQDSLSSRAVAQDVLSQIDALKEKINDQEYLELCNSLKNLSTSKHTFVKVQYWFVQPEMVPEYDICRCDDCEEKEIERLVLDEMTLNMTIENKTFLATLPTSCNCLVCTLPLRNHQCMYKELFEMDGKMHHYPIDVLDLFENKNLEKDGDIPWPFCSHDELRSTKVSWARKNILMAVTRF